VHPDRPLHLRLPGTATLRAGRLRTRGSSRGLPHRYRCPLVPQAPDSSGSPAELELDGGPGRFL